MKAKILALKKSISFEFHRINNRGVIFNFSGTVPRETK